MDEPAVEPEPVPRRATSHPGDDDDSSDISDDSDHESDPEDTDMNLTENPEYNEFIRRMSTDARTAVQATAQTIGSYVTGTANQAMRNLNAAVKGRERRRKDRRRERRAAREAQRTRRVRRNREIRPPSTTATGGTAVQARLRTGRATTQHVEVESSPGPHVDTPSSPASVHAGTGVPEAPKLITEPSGPSVSKISKEKREKCRSKTSDDLDEPGCGNYGNGVKNKENPLTDCGWTHCNYKRFCRNCKEGRDASGKLVTGRHPKKPKGISVDDEITEGGPRFYCSRGCLKNDKEDVDDDEDDDGDTQVRCRAQTSVEEDEPGCGQKFTKASPRAICARQCGKRKFCIDCVEGIDENGNTIEAKGIKVSDPEDGGYWFYCSEECQRLDDKEDEGNAESSGKLSSEKPGNSEEDDKDEKKDDPNAEVASEEDERYPPSKPGQAKNPDGTHCQNKFCGKAFNKTKKRLQCGNPDCVKNKNYCIGCIKKMSIASSKGERPSGRMTENPRI